MSGNFFKEDCLNRAKELLEKGDDALLRYVCLELRFCIESITYDKLRTYIKRLPQSVLERWQPPQAMRALLELEPLADEDFELFISPETAPGLPTGEWVCLGHHKTFKLSWLRKTYNKLGSFLHVPSPAQNQKIRSDGNKVLRIYVEKVVAELDPIVESSMDAGLAQVVTFSCKKCGEPIIANVEGVKRIKRVECLNQNCRAEFASVESEDGRLSFHIMTSNFPCGECGEANHIENRQLSIGYKFTCESCGAQHEIASRQWGYQVIDQKSKSS